jgi:hypothetical protein
MEEAKRDDNELTRKQAVSLGHPVARAETKPDIEPRATQLKDMFAKKKDHAKDAAQKADEKTGTFKLVTDPSDSVVRGESHHWVAQRGSFIV